VLYLCLYSSAYRPYSVTKTLVPRNESSFCADLRENISIETDLGHSLFLILYELFVATEIM